MPSKPACFHRLPEILDVLTHMDASHLDRQGIETFFGVGPRRARQLMAGLPGIRAGNAAAISRQALIERMRETAASGVYQWEIRRRGRVVEELDRTRRERAARRVQIPVSPDVHRRRFGDLPETIDLRPGELRIAFSDAEDLARGWWNCPRQWLMTGPALSERSSSDRPLPTRPPTAKQVLSR